VLETLLNAGVLNRLYLTQVHRFIGGEIFDTLLEGGLVQGTIDFRLQALYYDQGEHDAFNQFFSVYNTSNHEHIAE